MNTYKSAIYFFYKIGLKHNKTGLTPLQTWMEELPVASEKQKQDKVKGRQSIHLINRDF